MKFAGAESASVIKSVIPSGRPKGENMEVMSQVVNELEQCGALFGNGLQVPARTVLDDLTHFTTQCICEIPVFLRLKIDSHPLDSNLESLTSYLTCSPILTGSLVSLATKDQHINSFLLPFLLRSFRHSSFSLFLSSSLFRSLHTSSHHHRLIIHQKNKNKNKNKLSLYAFFINK